jgi:predicted lipid-binding transport protein (Tim44 family)
MRSRSQQPAAAVRPVSPAVRRRRQEVLATLGAAAVLTLLCTVAFGGAFVLLHLVADVLLVAYVVMLVQVTNAPATQPRRADGYAVRSASSGLAGSELGAIGRVTPVNARRIAN